MTATLTHDEIDGWCEEGSPAMALHLREVLLPVEGRGAVVFPPTFALSDSERKARKLPYQINEDPDGTKTVELDTVGSQANRLEPVFERPTLAGLVPLHVITHGNEATTSILRAGHRLGDAIIRCTDLRKPVAEAFDAFLRSSSNDVRDLAKLGPTSIVFGVWDSRASQAKLPRLVQSVIRATDVSPQRRSAQYFPTIDHKKEGTFAEKDLAKAETEAKQGGGGDLAELGYVAVPATDTHGGVVVRGEIVRDCTVNLVALRRLGAPTDVALRRYLLGLALVAATFEQDYFLRAGCQLHIDPEVPSVTRVVFRRGHPKEVIIQPQDAISYAQKSAEAFGVEPGRMLAFSKKFAEEDRERWSAKNKEKGKGKEKNNKAAEA